MLSDFYVYTHTRNDTGATFYVGKGRAERAHRTSHRGEHWKRIAAKHGRSVHIVAAGLTDELALLAEVELIDKLRRIGAPLINQTVGGDGAKLTPEAEARRLASISAAHQRPELIARRTEHSRQLAADPELRDRRNASIRAAYMAPGLRALLASLSRTEKARLAHADAMARPEVRAKLSAAFSVPVQCVESGSTFPSMLAARDWLRESGHPRAQSAHICQTCRGNRRSAYGYTWRYAPKG